MQDFKGLEINHNPAKDEITMGKKSKSLPKIRTIAKYPRTSPTIRSEFYDFEN